MVSENSSGHWDQDQARIDKRSFRYRLFVKYSGELVCTGLLPCGEDLSHAKPTDLRENEISIQEEPRRTEAVLRGVTGQDHCGEGVQR